MEKTGDKINNREGYSPFLNILLKEVVNMYNNFKKGKAVKSIMELSNNAGSIVLGDTKYDLTEDIARLMNDHELEAAIGGVHIMAQCALGEEAADYLVYPIISSDREANIKTLAANFKRVYFVMFRLGLITEEFKKFAESLDL